MVAPRSLRLVVAFGFGLLACGDDASAGGAASGGGGAGAGAGGSSHQGGAATGGASSGGGATGGAAAGGAGTGGVAAGGGATGGAGTGGAGTGGAGTGGALAGGGGAGGGTTCLAFGSPCAMGDVCCDEAGETGQCYAFGMGPRCTIPCPPNPADCPNNGLGCNAMNPPVCRP